MRSKEIEKLEAILEKRLKIKAENAKKAAIAAKKYNEEKLKEEHKLKQFYDSSAPKALKHSQEIFRWAGEFCNSKLGQGLLREFEDWFYFFSTQSFNGIEGRRGSFLSVGLDLRANRLFYGSSGCGARSRSLESPEDMTARLDPRYIQLLYDHIFSGRVLDVIRERIERI